MAFHFEYDAVHGILCGRVEGPMTDQSLREYYRLVGEHADRLQPRGGIADFSAVTSFDVSSETVHDLARLAPAMPDPALPRVVVAPSPLIYGMSRVFQAVGGDSRPTLRVVRTLEEAYQFVGVPSPRFEPLPEAAPGGPAAQARPR